MRARKLREEATEKERDEHFNTIRPMIPTKQEWRVKKKTSTPALTASDDDMDLQDDDESPLIKDGSPLPTGTDINMLFTLPAEFRGVGGGGGNHSDVPWSQGGCVREGRGVEPSIQSIVHLRSHRWEADLQDARRWCCCCQPDAVLHLQEACEGGR
jgi:hypothetical protein